MRDANRPVSSRRELLQNTGRLAVASAVAGATIPPVHAAGTAFAGMAVPPVHAAGTDLIQVALVGCGGRGTGAAANALSTKCGPIRLVAMADLFEAQLWKSYKNLHGDTSLCGKLDVPIERQFVGFDAFKQAMDCLKPGDVVIFATPPAFRWVHFTYAIEKGLNVFMEKPVTVDGPTSKRMFALGEAATKKNLKVGVGLMSRHCRGMQELAKRVHDGAMGEIVLQRGYRMHGPVGYFESLPTPHGTKDLMYQIQRFHSFLWASGGNYSDFYIHVIDHLCWMKNAWPVKAQALGGRHYRKSPEGLQYIDQNFDTYSVEYTYPDGTKLFFDGRCMEGCEGLYASYMHGSKGSAVVSKAGDIGQPSSIYKTQSLKRPDLVWESKTEPEEREPYVNEWNDLIEAIRKDKPYNEVKRGVEASLVTSMGRMAAHTGREITYNDMLNCKHEFAPGVDTLTTDSPAPLTADKNGSYPVPNPGVTKTREY